MDERELRRRIERGEDLHTEFTAKLPDGGSLAKSIACFANTDGGQLIIGVADGGAVTGLADLDHAARVVDDVAFQRCEPPITVVQETVTSEGSTVLVVNVPKGSQRPYRTASGHYYVRSTNRCRQASREELLRLFQSAGSLYFDESLVHKASTQDLNLDELERFLQDHFGVKASADELPAYLRNLGLAGNGHPTLTGVLFFGRRPQAFVPGAKLIAAQIPGTDIGLLPADKKEISGRIPQILEDAERFLRLYLKEAHEIRGVASERKPELPEAAWREAIVNAVAHRDYTISAPIRLIVFRDRIEIRAPGKLPNTVTIERMRFGGAHVLRNPTIYNLLARMGLVTDLGSGVRRMVRAVREHIGKEVLLEETDTEFVVTLPRPG